jgi:hypothetical protein
MFKNPQKTTEFDQKSAFKKTLTTLGKTKKNG